MFCIKSRIQLPLAMLYSSFCWWFCIFLNSLLAPNPMNAQKNICHHFCGWKNVFPLFGTLVLLSRLLFSLWCVVINLCFFNIFLQKLAWIAFKHVQTLVRNIHLIAFLIDFSKHSAHRWSCVFLSKQFTDMFGMSARSGIFTYRSLNVTVNFFLYFHQFWRTWMFIVTSG